MLELDVNMNVFIRGKLQPKHTSLGIDSAVVLVFNCLKQVTGRLKLLQTIVFFSRGEYATKIFSLTEGLMSIQHDQHVQISALYCELIFIGDLLPALRSRYDLALWSIVFLFLLNHIKCMKLLLSNFFNWEYTKQQWSFRNGSKYWNIISIVHWVSQNYSIPSQILFLTQKLTLLITESRNYLPKISYFF